KRGDVLQPHIQPLTGDRMNEVGGVANERNALGDKRTRDEETERMDAPRADRGDLAEMQFETLLELGMKGVIRQRHNAFRLARRLGPHDRRAMPLERENGERPGRQKVLLGATAMI